MSFYNIENYEKSKPISDLLLKAIPETRIVKSVSSSTSIYFSNHAGANVVSGEFKELDNVLSFFAWQTVCETSRFLKSLQRKKFTVCRHTSKSTFMIYLRD